MAVIQTRPIQRPNPWSGIGPMLLNVWDMYKNMKEGNAEKNALTAATDAWETTQAPSKFPPVEEPPMPAASQASTLPPNASLDDILKALGIQPGPTR